MSPAYNAARKAVKDARKAGTDSDLDLVDVAIDAAVDATDLAMADDEDAAACKAIDDALTAARDLGVDTSAL